MIKKVKAITAKGYRQVIQSGVVLDMCGPLTYINPFVRVQQHCALTPGDHDRQDL